MSRETNKIIGAKDTSLSLIQLHGWCTGVVQRCFFLILVSSFLKLLPFRFVSPLLLDWTIHSVNTVNTYQEYITNVCINPFGRTSFAIYRRRYVRVIFPWTGQETAQFTDLWGLFNVVTRSYLSKLEPITVDWYYIPIPQVPFVFQVIRTRGTKVVTQCRRQQSVAALDIQH